MLAAANAAVVPGRVTETVAVLAATVATRKLGTKSRSCLAAAMTSCFRVWFPHPPSIRPLASNRAPPNANRRPPRRRRAYGRRPGSFSISRRNVGPSRPFRSNSSLLLDRLFIGEFLEQAVGRDAVIALAEHGKQIGNDQQGGGSGKKNPADPRARQPCVLLLAGAANRHRDHADDHRCCRHQHGADSGAARVKGSTERAPPLELLLARECDQK